SLPACLLAAIYRYRLGMTCQAIAGLLGVDHSTISVTTRHIAGLLAQHGTAITPGPHRIRTPGDLHRHAAAAGITITIHGQGAETGDMRALQATEDHDTPKLKTDAAQKKVDIHDNHFWLLGAGRLAAGAERGGERGAEGGRDFFRRFMLGHPFLRVPTTRAANPSRHRPAGASGSQGLPTVPAGRPGRTHRACSRARSGYPGTVGYRRQGVARG